MLDDDEIVSIMESELGGEDTLMEEEEEEGDSTKKKDKKLVFLSRSVLEKVREKPMTTGT
jgi:hypothetical protein